MTPQHEQEQKQENDDQKAVPRPSTLVLFLDRIGIRGCLDVVAYDGFRIGTKILLGAPLADGYICAMARHALHCRSVYHAGRVG